MQDPTNIEQKEAIVPSSDRRSIIKAAAWSVPAVALAVAAPQASASTTPSQCVFTGQSGLIVTLTPSAIIITTPKGYRDAIDVTIRQRGLPEYHRNYVTQGKNPGDNQITYAPGDTIVVPIPRAFAVGDWAQIKDVHPVACA